MFWEEMPLFAVVEVGERIFKFTVFSKSVGLEVYALNSFANNSFKVFFHLWNKKGFDLAKSSSIKDSRPSFEWVEVKKKKAHHSYADAVKSSFPAMKKSDPKPAPFGKVFSHLTNDLDRRSVFTRLNFRNLSHDLAKNTGNHVLPTNGVNFDLNLSLSNLNKEVLTGANQVPLGSRSQPKLFSRPLPVGRRNCSRCLSFSHLQPNCVNRVRCS